MVVVSVLFVEVQFRDTPHKRELKADDKNRVATGGQSFLLDGRVLVDVVPGKIAFVWFALSLLFYPNFRRQT